jgi:hypothetical protein
MSKKVVGRGGRGVAKTYLDCGEEKRVERK